ncbi:MAG TPA: Gfo/Idh/MocA family oxidoreductase [Caldilineaceae bacterium]|nr:Gfo/Idh/MocA family oxidoreductase [Caldilineaceae bacterium]
MTAELNVGVIGCGGHAQSHFAMIKAEPRMKLVAIAEIDETRRNKAKADHQPQFAFADYRDLLDKTQLDVVYVVTLAGHLLPIIQECLGRNIHTSIEKAPGYTAAETRQMVAAAHASKAKAIVSFNRRYMPEILAVRQLAQARGGATQVAANYHKPASGMVPPDRQSVVPPELTSDAIHHVDLIRWMAGRTQAEARVATELYAHTWRGAGVPAPHHNAVIKFDDHTHGVMMSHFGVGYRIQSAEVHAEAMSAYLDLTSKPQVTLYLDGSLVDTPLDLDAVGGPNFNETRHFVDCILNDSQPWSTIDDAVKTMDLCEAIVAGHQGRL